MKLKTLVFNNKRLRFYLFEAGVMLLIIMFFSGCLLTKTRQFGKLPEGTQLKYIKQLPNYRDDEFQNEVLTPVATEGVSTLELLWGFLKPVKNKYPMDQIPVERTDLNKLDRSQEIFLWMGHSSSFLQVSGKRILIDPVLSKSASPFSFINKAYEGTSIYKPEDIPEIDVLIISHDHWDHLDYPTVIALRSKIKKVVCGIGTGEHFRRWGFSESQIEERNWNEELCIDSSLTIVVTPARHTSGRAFTQKQALWSSYVIITPIKRIYYSGDTGYGNHFKFIGNKYGPFDLALMECGQYDPKWKYVHMQPEETLQATLDLRARYLAPVHWGKFTEAGHSWFDPIKRISKLAAKTPLYLVAPKIGQLVDLNHIPVLLPWWESVR
jgi:L-ascorbate metabolism protein UlaG (beta-lactamase superfamily)